MTLKVVHDGRFTGHHANPFCSSHFLTTTLCPNTRTLAKRLRAVPPAHMQPVYIFDTFFRDIPNTRPSGGTTLRRATSIGIYATGIYL